MLAKGPITATHSPKLQQRLANSKERPATQRSQVFFRIFSVLFCIFFTVPLAVAINRLVILAVILIGGSLFLVFERSKCCKLQRWLVLERVKCCELHHLLVLDSFK